MVMDIIVEYTLHNKLFKREEMVCTKTLYKYVLLESLPIKHQVAGKSKAEYSKFASYREQN